MASKRIQGITVEIGGDTSKLTAALRDVDKSLSTTQGNLRDVNKLLKLDPGNTELLAQKHRLLGEAVKERFGEDAEPLYERLAEFFRILESYHFVNFN